MSQKILEYPREAGSSPPQVRRYATLDCYAHQRVDRNFFRTAPQSGLDSNAFSLVVRNSDNCIDIRPSDE